MITPTAWVLEMVNSKIKQINTSCKITAIHQDHEGKVQLTYKVKNNSWNMLCTLVVFEVYKNNTCTYFPRNRRRIDDSLENGQKQFTKRCQIDLHQNTNQNTGVTPEYNPEHQSDSWKTAEGLQSIGVAPKHQPEHRSDYRKTPEWVQKTNQNTGVTPEERRSGSRRTL